MGNKKRKRMKGKNVWGLGVLSVGGRTDCVLYGQWAKQNGGEYPLCFKAFCGIWERIVYWC